MSTEDNSTLCKAFSEEEIKHALFQTETNNKAAGLDSIPNEFYESCWEIMLKMKSLKMFEDFHAGKLNVSISCTNYFHQWHFTAGFWKPLVIIFTPVHNGTSGENWLHCHFVMEPAIKKIFTAGSCEEPVVKTSPRT